MDKRRVEDIRRNCKEMIENARENTKQSRTVEMAGNIKCICILCTELGLLSFAWICLGVLGCAWVCLKLFAWDQGFGNWDLVSWI